MQDVILQISSRIKEKRKEKKITVQQLAEGAGVTKGLISQIENNRTIPSLSVLLSIIGALGVDFNDFFSNLAIAKDDAVIVKAGEHETVEKEYTEGSYYNRIMAFKQNGKLVDVVLYRQEKDAVRGYVTTDAFEFNYMIEGEMEYTIGEKVYRLSKGDSFYYDARRPHLSKCVCGNDYTMLVIYFFDEE